MEGALDRLHARARAMPGLHRLALVSRIALALAFVPTGMVKVLGERFTVMPTNTPVGYFFEALYQSGAYWNFIGLAQVVAGALLLMPRTATLAAVLAFPIVLNIFVITVSLRFVGTPFVTGAMLLAATFLLAWDYHRLKAIVWPGAAAALPARPAPMGGLERAGFAIGTCAGLGVLGTTRGLVPGSATTALLAVGSVAALMVLCAWIRSALPTPARHRS